MSFFALRSKKRVVWLLAVLLLIVLGAAVVLMRQQKASKEEAQSKQSAVGLDLTQSDVLILKAQSLQLGIEISGNLKAAQSAWVKAKSSGEVQGLSVREGDVVSAGQVLGRIDPIDAQTRLEQAQQQAKSAQGQLQIAQRAYQNNKALLEQGFISQTALENASGSLTSAQANYRAAQASVQLMQKGLSDTVLKSPIHGVVSQRLIQNAERVNVESRIVEVVNLRQLELEAALSTAESLQVKVGQFARLQVEGLPQTLLAKVERINPSAQAGTRSILVYLSLPNPDNNLRQGLYAQGRLQTQTLQTLAVPESAVRYDKPRPYVQLVQAGRVHHLAVAVGAKGLLQDSSATSGSELSLAPTSNNPATDLSAGSNPEESADALPQAQSSVTTVANPNQRWVQISAELGNPPLQEGAIILTGAVGALPQGTQLNLPKGLK